MAQLNFFQQRQTFTQARKEFDTLLKHYPSSLNIKITFILLGLSWLILFFFWRKLPPQVPLLYSRPWGEYQLMAKAWLALLPGISTGLTIINLRLASLFFKNQRFLSQLITWLNFTIVILAVTSLIRILLIII